MSYNQDISFHHSFKHVHQRALTVIMAGGEGSRFVVEAKKELSFCLRVIVIRSSCPAFWYWAGPGDGFGVNYDHSPVFTHLVNPLHPSGLRAQSSLKLTQRDRKLHCVHCKETQDEHRYTNMHMHENTCAITDYLIKCKLTQLFWSILPLSCLHRWCCMFQGLQQPKNQMHYTPYCFPRH